MPCTHIEVDSAGRDWRGGFAVSFDLPNGTHFRLADRGGGGYLARVCCVFVFVRAFTGGPSEFSCVLEIIAGCWATLAYCAHSDRGHFEFARV